jgi:hypothetical protein
MGGMEARAGRVGLPDKGETGCGVDPARQLVTRCVSFGEGAYPHPDPPPLRRGGNGGSPPLSALFADGWGGGRPWDR